MGKSKVVILILSILFTACSSNKQMFMKQQENIFGKYIYRNQQCTLSISLELMSDSSFVFEQVSGLDKKYSKGNFKLINTGDIIINSVYEGTQGTIQPVSWVNFNNKTLTLNKNKVKYENYILSK